jgi:2'-5' RNA ligase
VFPAKKNSFFPFVPRSEFDNIAQTIGAAMREFGPIKISLSHFGHFSHSATSKTLYLEPDAASRAALQKLYAKLELAMPICANPSHDSFTPHLTLGQFHSDVRMTRDRIDRFDRCVQAAVQAMKEELAKNWTPIEWTLGAISALSRGASTPFEEIRTYELVGTPGQLPSDNPNSDSIGASISLCF